MRRPLKMYNGDFCGTGEAYTEQGTKIHWTNNLGWQCSAGNTSSMESLWNANGAVCLSTHRLHGISTVDYQTEIQGAPPLDGGAPDSGTAGACPKPACPVEDLAGLVASGQYLFTESTALP